MWNDGDKERIVQLLELDNSQLATNSFLAKDVMPYWEDFDAQNNTNIVLNIQLAMDEAETAIVQAETAPLSEPQVKRIKSDLVGEIENQATDRHKDQDFSVIANRKVNKVWNLLDPDRYLYTYKMQGRPAK